MKKCVLMVVLIAFCSIGYSEPNEELFTKWREQGIESVMAGNLKNAQVCFQAALTFKPDDPTIRKALAMIEQRLNKAVVPESPVVAKQKPIRTVIDKPKEELMISGRTYFPGDDFYDFGFGVEFQSRTWHANNFGFAIAGGFANWNVKEERMRQVDGIETMDISIDGSNILVPIGGSVLYKQNSSDHFSYQLEGGMRYVFVNSNTDADVIYFDGFSSYNLSEQIKFDEGLIGLFAVNFSEKISDTMRFTGGMGYQFDIIKGDVELFGEKIDENKLKAFFISIGFVVDI